ncbi:hypothetical protein Tco_1115535, partial [Tanacetum coccineum]
LRTNKIWMPKIRKDDESTSISPTIDIVSRITNVLKISNSLGSNLSSVPSSSNSLADCTTHPIHSDQASVFMAMTSDHNRSELEIQDHSNEQSSSKLVPKVCSSSKQDSYITTKVGITIPLSRSNAEDNSQSENSLESLMTMENPSSVIIPNSNGQ